jgi:hypothetical protein
MKQGTGNSKAGDRKVEPKSKAKNPGKVADIGMQVVRSRQHVDLGRGEKAPAPQSSSTSKSGSQGKHR